MVGAAAVADVEAQVGVEVARAAVDVEAEVVAAMAAVDQRASETAAVAMMASEVEPARKVSAAAPVQTVSEVETNLGIPIPFPANLLFGPAIRTEAEARVVIGTVEAEAVEVAVGVATVDAGVEEAAVVIETAADLIIAPAMIESNED